MKYKKKPVVIEAQQYDGSNNPFGAIKQHQCNYRMCPLCGGDNQPHDYIETMHDGQLVVVKPGDWIIPDGKPNTFYPCKPDIFEKTYSPAESPLEALDSQPSFSLQQRMKEFFAKVSPEQLIETFEKMGYKFIPPQQQTDPGGVDEAAKEVISFACWVTSAYPHKPSVTDIDKMKFLYGKYKEGADTNSTQEYYDQVTQPTSEALKGEAINWDDALTNVPVRVHPMTENYFKSKYSLYIKSKQ